MKNYVLFHDWYFKTITVTATCIIVIYTNLVLKRLVHPKMKILSVFTVYLLSVSI